MASRVIAAKSVSKVDISMTYAFLYLAVPLFHDGMSSKRGEQKPRKRSDLGARWTSGERAEIDELAKSKGVKPTQIIRMAVRKFLDDEKRK